MLDVRTEVRKPLIEHLIGPSRPPFAVIHVNMPSVLTRAFQPEHATHQILSDSNHVWSAIDEFGSLSNVVATLVRCKSVKAIDASGRATGRRFLEGTVRASNNAPVINQEVAIIGGQF